MHSLPEPQATRALHLPKELLRVPPPVLKDFLRTYSHVLACELVPNASGDTVARAFQAAYARIVPVESEAEGVPQLHLSHDCKHKGCNLEDCALCKNNPLKRCCHPHVLDSQYWVRDDGKGGQLIRAKCGARIYFTATCPSSSGTAGAQIVKLYIVDSNAYVFNEHMDGLYLGDDGRPLFACQGVSPQADGGLLLTPTTDPGGQVRYELPDLQFLNKNSRFKAGGQTFRAFKMVARLVKTDPGTGKAELVSVVESGTFKVTTKKGYDGCRKSEYLYCKEVVTDKTFASIGETTINNLRIRFGPANTVEDLVALIKQAKNDTGFEAQLREVLNMSKDSERWRSFCKTLQTKVVHDDSVPRTWWTPDHSIGLVFKCDRGEVSFSPIVGLVLNDQTAIHNRSASRESLEQLLLTCTGQLEKLRAWAVNSWEEVRHPGWEMMSETELEMADVGTVDLMLAFDQAIAAPPSRTLAAKDSAASGAATHLEHVPTPSSTPPVHSPHLSGSSIPQSRDTSTPPLPFTHTAHMEGGSGHWVAQAPARAPSIQENPHAMGQVLYSSQPMHDRYTTRLDDPGVPPGSSAPAGYGGYSLDGALTLPTREVVTTGWPSGLPTSQPGGTPVPLQPPGPSQCQTDTGPVLTEMFAEAMKLGYSLQLLQQAARVLSAEQMYVFLRKAIARRLSGTPLDQRSEPQELPGQQPYPGFPVGYCNQAITGPMVQHCPTSYPYGASQGLGPTSSPAPSTLPSARMHPSPADVSPHQRTQTPDASQPQLGFPVDSPTVSPSSSIMRFFRDAMARVPSLHVSAKPSAPSGRDEIAEGVTPPSSAKAAGTGTELHDSPEAPSRTAPHLSSGPQLSRDALELPSLTGFMLGSFSTQELNLMEQSWDDLIDEDFQGYLRSMMETGSQEDLDNALEYLRSVSSSSKTDQSSGSKDNKRNLSSVNILPQLVDTGTTGDESTAQLSSDSIGIYHVKSGGRHFPRARVSSVLQGVHQGQPVAEPAWLRSAEEGQGAEKEQRQGGGPAVHDSLLTMHTGAVPSDAATASQLPAVKNTPRWKRRPHQSGANQIHPPPAVPNPPVPSSTLGFMGRMQELFKPPKKEM